MLLHFWYLLSEKRSRFWTKLKCLLTCQGLDYFLNKLINFLSINCKTSWKSAILAFAINLSHTSIVHSNRPTIVCNLERYFIQCWNGFLHSSLHCRSRSIVSRWIIARRISIRFLLFNNSQYPSVPHPSSTLVAIYRKWFIRLMNFWTFKLHRTGAPSSNRERCN